MPRMAEAVRRSILQPSLDAALGGARRTMLVTALDPTTSIYIPLLRRWHDRPGPPSCQLLFSAYARMRLERLSAHSFRLERLDVIETGPDLYALAFNRDPLREGQQFDSLGLRVTVERTHAALLVQARYEVDVMLDDPTTVLLIQTHTGLRQLAFPPIGQSVILEPAAQPWLAPAS